MDGGLMDSAALSPQISKRLSFQISIDSGYSSSSTDYFCREMSPLARSNNNSKFAPCHEVQSSESLENVEQIPPESEASMSPNRLLTKAPSNSSQRSFYFFPQRQRTEMRRNSSLNDLRQSDSSLTEDTQLMFTLGRSSLGKSHDSMVSSQSVDTTTSNSTTSTLPPFQDAPVFLNNRFLRRKSISTGNLHQLTATISSNLAASTEQSSDTEDDPSPPVFNNRSRLRKRSISTGALDELPLSNLRTLAKQSSKSKSIKKSFSLFVSKSSSFRSRPGLRRKSMSTSNLAQLHLPGTATTKPISSKRPWSSKGILSRLSKLSTFGSQVSLNLDDSTSDTTSDINQPLRIIRREPVTARQRLRVAILERLKRHMAAVYRRQR